MMEFGGNLGMPHTKSLGNGLFEIRLKGQEGIAIKRKKEIKND